MLSCAAERRLSAGAKPARQLSLQPVAVVAVQRFEEVTKRTESLCRARCYVGQYAEAAINKPALPLIAQHNIFPLRVPELWPVSPVLTSLPIPYSPNRGVCARTPWNRTNPCTQGGASRYPVAAGRGCAAGANRQADRRVRAHHPEDRAGVGPAGAGGWRASGGRNRPGQCKRPGRVGPRRWNRIARP